ncbi:MAG: MBL fold metallo-hydrolase [Rhodospirillaceae bacterium]|jgi:metallo-beta-lactamase family protein|nr:MBL fold metallo-hydrolase [Rhodospirillaceae bacterium]
MAVTLTFHGAAGTVTGSHYVLQTPRARIAVDCGMFQGPKILKELNYQELPSDPAHLDAVVQTHAHTDHSGMLPKLVKSGFRGPIFATEGTRDLLEWMLPDSAGIQEGEVEQLNRQNRRRGLPPVVPVYDGDDARRTLKHIKPVAYDTWQEVAHGIRGRWWNAGHILGSASIELEVETGNDKLPRLGILFSGDLGPRQGALQTPSTGPQGMDYVLCESTYGDREREDLDDDKRRAILEKEVKTALDAGGNLLIPAFAIERSQELLGDLVYLMARKRLPRAPVYLDSPLAIGATEVFERHLHLMDDVDNGGMSPFRAPNVHFVESVEQSQALNRIAGGAIIIASSGMCDAGRIRHHLRHNIWRPQTTVLLIGYQAPGTLGRLLQDGAPRVKLMGEEIEVKARIRKLEIYSGHADRGDLRNWVKARLPIARGLFLVHGEIGALAGMRDSVLTLGLDAERVILPELDQRFQLDRQDGALALEDGRRLEPTRAEEVRRGWDWHNELSAVSLDLRRQLDDLGDDKARMKLLKDLRRMLEKTGSAS